MHHKKSNGTSRSYDEPRKLGQGKRLEKFMKEKIMIVDDHEDIREVVHVLLTNEGYQIVKPKMEKEALELLDDEIDLIILDVMMPEMNGYQACLLMREKTNAPILFLTAKVKKVIKH